jgi:hypothetical protein
MVPFTMIVYVPASEFELVSHSITLFELSKVKIDVLPDPEVLTNVEYTMSFEVQQFEFY